MNTATSVCCPDCCDPLTIFNGVFIDSTCQRAYDREGFEAIEEQWALYQARATAEHLEESRWEEARWDS